MPTVIPSPLDAHYLLPATSLAIGMLVMRGDGVNIGFTSTDKSVTIDSVLFQNDPGLDVTAIVTTAGFEVGNLQINTLDDGTVFVKSELLGGLWRNAGFYLFQYNFENPPAGLNGTKPLLAGNFGEVTFGVGDITIELRDLRQYLQQDVGSVSQKTCRYRFGDAKCGLSIAGPPFKVTDTITSVTAPGNRIFASSGLAAYPEDYFGDGLIKFTSGPCTGQEFKIKEFNTGTGQITLILFTFAALGTSNAFEITAGCRLRFDEDCKIKFGNELNFGGEPHRRGVNNLTGAP